MSSLGDDKKDMAIHVERRAKRSHEDGESKEGGSGRIHMEEKKYNLDGSVQPISKYNKLLNKYELMGVWDLSDPVSASEVPEIVRSDRTVLIAEEEEVFLGHIDPTDAELKAYNVQSYKPSAQTLLSVPRSYNFETANPDAAANKIVNQGDCGSCWTFASSKSYSMSLYQQSNGQ